MWSPTQKNKGGGWEDIWFCSTKTRNSSDHHHHHHRQQRCRLRFTIFGHGLDFKASTFPTCLTLTKKSFALDITSGLPYLGGIMAPKLLSHLSKQSLTGMPCPNRHYCYTVISSILIFQNSNHISIFPSSSHGLFKPRLMPIWQDTAPMSITRCNQHMPHMAISKPAIYFQTRTHVVKPFIKSSLTWKSNYFLTLKSLRSPLTGSPNLWLIQWGHVWGNIKISYAWLSPILARVHTKTWA